jgi:hypothetical protein
MLRDISLSALALCVSTTAIAAADWDNPYANPSSEFEARLQDAEFGRPGADMALQKWLAFNATAPAEERLRGYRQLCGDFGVLSWNRPRLAACIEETRLKLAVGKAEDGDDDQGMAAALAEQPPIRAIGSASVPLIWNNFGSQSTEVSVHGVSSSWFVDTGAEITVVVESLAQRMGITSVAEKIRVGTSTSDVFGKVGMIDRLRIGSADVENVPVLILPDAQLKIGNVHQIEGILGLPVMVAFGRVAWTHGGTRFALGEAAPKARLSASRIYWHEEGLGVPVSTPRGIRGAHLDTGANVTDWRQPGAALLEPTLLAKAQERIAHVGGAGGVIEVKQKRLPSVRFQIGTLPVALDDIALLPEGPVSAARIGMDSVSQFGEFILDFEQMRIDGRLKTAAERKATRRRELSEDDVKLESDKRDPAGN